MSKNNRMLELLEFFKTNPSLEEVYERYYSKDVVIQENIQLMNANVKEIHEFKIGVVLVDGDRSMVEMHLDATTQDGYQLHIEEVGLQTWKDGRIIHERYFYDPSSFEGRAKEYNPIHERAY